MPSTSPAVSTPTMCGCCSVAASMISRLKRSTETDAANSGGNTLTTTRRPSVVSKATKTRDMPPPVSSRSTVNDCPSLCCSPSLRSNIYGDYDDLDDLLTPEHALAVGLRSVMGELELRSCPI